MARCGAAGRVQAQFLEDQRPWRPVEESLPSRYDAKVSMDFRPTRPMANCSTHIFAPPARLKTIDTKGQVMMKANVGDWLVAKGTTTEQPEHRGMITEVGHEDGSPPYRVRWLDNGHEALVFPGPDALVVTQAQQTAADERARARLASVQAAIMHRRPGDD